MSNKGCLSCRRFVVQQIHNKSKYWRLSFMTKSVKESTKLDNY